MTGGRFRSLNHDLVFLGAVYNLLGSRISLIITDHNYNIRNLAITWLY